MGVNVPKAAEAMVMSDMLTCIQKHASLNAEGDLIIINDNALLNREENENGVNLSIMQMMLVG